MHGTPNEWKSLAQGIVSKANEVDGVDMLLCPPFPGLEVVGNITGQTHGRVSLGAQDIHHEDKGAFTGSVSAEMVTSCGGEYVIVGHSERRAECAEGNVLIGKKVRQALRRGLKPILCIGETLQQRNAGDTIKVLDEQLVDGLQDVYLNTHEDLVIAYEPVWAISSSGVARKPKAEEIGEVLRFVRASLESQFADFGFQIRVLYGGSVNPGNVEELFAENAYDGALVGSASLQSEKFLALAKAFKAMQN